MRGLRLAILVMASVMALDASAATYQWALPEWRATWSAPRFADDRGFAVEATADAVYVAGVTGSQTTGAGDLFLLRYDLAGTLQWSRTWGGFELDQAQAIAVDETGIWVAGSATNDEGEISALLLKYGHDGTELLASTWKAHDTAVVTVLQAVAVDGDQVYVAGLAHPTRPDRNLYVARLDVVDRELVRRWESTQGATEWDEAWDVALEDGTLYVAGYVTPNGATTTDGLLLVLDADGNEISRAVWNDGSNDEVRAVEVTPDAVYVTGGIQEGRSTDIYVAKVRKSDLGREWVHNTGGTVSGGGGYGIAVGEQGIYVAGGNYDFPAGGDTAILRFSHDGALEWSQIMGYPGFWDWGFDVDARDGRFYVAGVLWKAGAEWYEILTLAYDEEFPTASLEQVAAQVATGDVAGARMAMDHFWFGDFLRWAEENGGSFSPEPVVPGVPPGDVDLGGTPPRPELPVLDPSGVTSPDPTGRSYVWWEGASGFGKNYGFIWVDTERDPVAGEDDGISAILGLQDDFESGNYALVRNYTGIRLNLFGGFLRARYYISHDRLIPQGGYIYVGDVGIAIPPPPV